MNDAEARGYVNACVRFANLNVTKYAPMIDQLGKRARGSLLDAWYQLYAYGEEAEGLPSAAVPIYQAMHADVLRARASAARKGTPERPDTRRGRTGNAARYEPATRSVAGSLRGRYGVGSGATVEVATVAATKTENAPLAAGALKPLANLLDDVRSTQIKNKDKDKDKKKGESDSVNPTCYETGNSYFHAPCPRCGKVVVARIDGCTGAASTTCGVCGTLSIEIPNGFEAVKGEDGYTLEMADGLTDGPDDAERG